MKSFRHSFRLLLSRRRDFAQALWRPYLALAFAAAILAVALGRMALLWALPAWVLHQEGMPSEVVGQVLGFDLPALILLPLGLIATLLAALWAHRRTLQTTRPYARPAGTSMNAQRRNLRIALSLAFLAAWMLIWMLPILNIVLGLAALTLAQLQGDLTAPTTALWTCFALLVGVGTLVLQIIVLHLRLALTHRAF